MKNIKNLYDESDLTDAVMSGDLKLTKALIAKGADVNEITKTFFGFTTALVLASVLDRVEIAQALMDKGANVNATDPFGNTVLMLAVKKGNVEMAQALMDKGANVNAKDPAGDTVLMLAVKNGNVEMAQALMDKGAKVDVTDKMGNTVLMLAVKNGNVKMVQALMYRGANPDAVDSDGFTALMKNSMSTDGKAEIANALIEGGANAFVTAPDGYDAGRFAGPYSKIAEIISKHSTIERIKERDESLLNKHINSILNGERLAPCTNLAIEKKLKALTFIRENKMKEIKENPEEFKKIKDSEYYPLLQLQENEKSENSDSWIKAILKNTQEFKNFYESVALFQASSNNEQQDRVFSIPELKNEILKSSLGENLKKDLQNLGENSTLEFIDKISVMASKEVKRYASTSNSVSTSSHNQLPDSLKLEQEELRIATIKSNDEVVKSLIAMRGGRLAVETSALPSTSFSVSSHNQLSGSLKLEREELHIATREGNDEVVKPLKPLIASGGRLAVETSALPSTSFSASSCGQLSGSITQEELLLPLKRNDDVIMKLIERERGGAGRQ